MAARRLIAVLIVLIVVSSIAAAIAPSARKAQDTTTTSTTSTTTTGPTATDSTAAGGSGSTTTTPGVLVQRTVSANTTGEPERIEVTAGDELVLHVTDSVGAEIEIPDLGQIEFASPNAPARFDLLLPDPGSYIVSRNGKTAVATIVISEPGAAAKGSQPAKRPGAVEPS